MNIGFYLRNMGPSSDRALLTAATQHAEAANLDAVWVADHIAIPPDDAEGSEGRYLDPLATLAYLAGCTEKIGLLAPHFYRIFVVFRNTIVYQRSAKFARNRLRILNTTFFIVLKYSVKENGF